MSGPRPIVIAVPDGHLSRAALAVAVGIGSRSGAAYRLVHAHQQPAEVGGEDREGQVLCAAARELRDLAGPEADLTTLAVHGHVVRAVVDASEDGDVLVVQRRDRSTARQTIGRSTSCALSAAAHVPVLVVPEEAVPAQHGTVTVGVDVPERSEVLLESAFAAASATGDRLRVVHCVWKAGGLGEYLVEQATAERHVTVARSLVDDAVARVHTRWPDVDVEVDVLRSEPAQALLLESAHSDLLVLERHDPVLSPGGRLGAVADALVRQSRCPVLVVAPTRRHRRSARPEVPAGTTTTETGSPRA